MKFLNWLLAAIVLAAFLGMVANAGIPSNFQPANSPNFIEVPVFWPLIGFGAIAIGALLLVGFLAFRK